MTCHVSVIFHKINEVLNSGCYNTLYRQFPDVFTKLGTARVVRKSAPLFKSWFVLIVPFIPNNYQFVDTFSSFKWKYLSINHIMQ